jgi:hypothetical protein
MIEERIRPQLQLYVETTHAELDDLTMAVGSIAASSDQELDSALDAIRREFSCKLLSMTKIFAEYSKSTLDRSKSIEIVSRLAELLSHRHSVSEWRKARKEVVAKISELHEQLHHLH